MVAPTQPQTPASAAKKYTKADFQTDQEVRWCPGCGDYAILNVAQQVFAQLGFPKHKMVMISGIGCSSRFPYYVNTYGFHTIHGRAPAVATGLKLANPELQVWVATGDGDALSIGGNHLMHALRRNVDIKILLFNNRIYGLTKGQYSPTTELGKKNDKSAPFGTVDQPINPISLALASEATFVARSVDVYSKHLMEILRKTADHKGSAFVEIYQNCNIFNDHAFEDFTEREKRDEWNVTLEHGKPLIFGAKKDKGIRLSGLKPEVVTLGQDGITEKDLIVHDEHNQSLAYLLSRLNYPNFPEPIGVFRNDVLPSLHERVEGQIADQKKKKGEGDLRKLLFAGDMWEVK
ncbi:MAG TPA: 2-oxoacid:ferredoxin oxidoreductase subunit beta [Planctomycetota bacterium]|nr:2-oxoacid:ferredoxin oxidoreductase subunit beta [Planctomycetota bacterium]